MRELSVVQKTPAQAPVKVGSPTSPHDPQTTHQENKTSFKWLTLVVAQDRLTVKARGHPPAGETTPDISDLEAMLKTLGVKVAPEISTLRQLVSALSRGRDAADAIVARGKAPTKGEDGRLELCIDEEEDINETSEDGRLDFREQALVQCAKADQLLARIVPPTLGEPGFDVFGQPIPALQGAAATVALGKNVRRSDDGTKIISTTDGAVSLSGSVFSVHDTYTVRGNVDYSTGNLTLERGSVLVEGDVRPGFRVAAEGDVLIRGVSDDAQVVSQADVRIARGAIGGYIRARGNAIIRFAQNVHIEAEGDVLVSGGIVHCEVLAGGKVLAQSGKGQIRGGTVRAAKGIEVKDLGSEGHVRTAVEIVAPHRVLAEFLMRLKGQEEALAKVARHVGEASDEELLARVAEDEFDEVSQLLSRRRELIHRVARLRKTIDSEQRTVRNQGEARILVYGRLHAGVVVTIGGAQLTVRDDMKRVQLFYDKERHMVRALPL
ncbi:MAG: FapA family protein [Myxococcota bacterium]|nr:FapA family protein [Myxococcota bacterium]